MVGITTPGSDDGHRFDHETVEHYTGKNWIDGKPIFRQVVDLQGLANGAILIAAGIVDTLVNVGGFSTINPGELTQIPFDDGTNFIGVNITVANGEIPFDRNIVPAAGSFTILEYTKI